MTKINTNLQELQKITQHDQEISINSFDGKTRSIFSHYDTNGDNKLDSGEISIFMQDLKAANNDENINDLSKSEARNFLSSLFPDMKLSVKNLNDFMSNILKSYRSNIETSSNGNIESFEQGESSDCWLLSEINSINKTTWGNEAIKNSITADSESQTYTIELKGVNYTTTLTQEDIQQARQNPKYSSGDLDVLLIELATERYFTQEAENGNIVINKDDVLGGNIPSGTLSLQYLLSGKTGHGFYLHKCSEEEYRTDLNNDLQNPVIKDRYLHAEGYLSYTHDPNTMENVIYKASNDSNSAIMCSFLPSDKWSNPGLYASRNNNDFYNTSEHAFVITNINKDENGNIQSIELSNPWDNDEPIPPMTFEEFMDKMEGVTIINENDYYEDLQEGFELLKIEKEEIEEE